MVGILVASCRCAMSWYDFDLTFDLAELILSSKSLSTLYQKL